mgnify:CR=1 FL=1
MTDLQLAGASEEKKFRALLSLHHGCTVPVEWMKCAGCSIDFQQDSVDEMAVVLRERLKQRMCGGLLEEVL